MIVYVGIGNSDGKLTSTRWAAFIEDVRSEVLTFGAQIHGEWYSLPNSRWVNVCWCVEIAEENVQPAKDALRALAGAYDQDSIAWAEAPTTILLVPGKK
jgi:hypothetical protein